MTQRTIRIGTKTIGYGQPVFVIAEAGVNHNGRLDLALKLVDAAADAGADAVKFQTFHAEDVVTGKGKMAAYQKKNLGKTESQVAMLKKLELQDRFYASLIARAKKRKILFFSAPHGGPSSVDFLRRLNVPAFKFGSGDLTNLPLLAYAAKMDIPVILGTGMSTMKEVRAAIRVIHRAGNRKLVALHCTSNYPCPFEEVNLRAMQTMMRDLDVLVGYSDHTEGIQVPSMAVTLGACVIEKHFTLNRKMKGPDHAASLEPDELTEMIRAIRRVPVILGSSVKRPTSSERVMMRDVRKSIVTLAPVDKGDVFTKKNLGIKRPGTGLVPRAYLDILGKRAIKDIDADTLLRRGDF